MTSLWLLAGVPVVMWIAQTIALRSVGLPIRWRIDSRSAPRAVRTAGRVATQLSLLAVILAYPLLRGEKFLSYYMGLFPANQTSLQFVQGMAASTLFLCALYIAWIATGRMRVEVHQERRRWMRRLALLVPTTVFGAFVEELLFRGVVMADLLRTPGVARWLAIALATLIFAVAHYVRSTKRKWTFPGHVMLGLMLCIAFSATNSLWLPTGLHAGGIFVIMGTRPFMVNRGPAWLTGASIFPFAGLAGLLGLSIMTGFIMHRFGVH
jgi:membrane protease YdiL (CAAX protease family)